MTLQHDLTMAASLMDEAAAILEALGPDVLEKLPNWRWPLTDELGGAAGILRDRLAEQADPTDWKAIARVQSAKLHVALDKPGAIERLEEVMRSSDWKRASAPTT
jgi:hypothetical protein